MAAIVVDGCRKVLVNQADQITAPAAEDITAGQIVFVDDSAGGKLSVAGNAVVGIFGIALTNALAGMECTAVIRGVVDVGDGLSDAADAAFSGAILAAADGAMDNATGTITVGYAWPGYASVGVDMLLWLPGLGGS